MNAADNYREDLLAEIQFCFVYTDCDSKYLKMLEDEYDRVAPMLEKFVNFKF